MLKTRLGAVCVRPFIVLIVCFLSASCGNDGDQINKPTNSKPVADAGSDQFVALPRTVTLDGSSSMDPDGDDLTFRWTLLSAPDGSAVTLTDHDRKTPSLIVDLVGQYLVELIVNDGALFSTPDLVVVTLSPTPRLHAFSQKVGAGLQFSGSVVLDTPDHGGVTIRIESSNASVALIASSGIGRGAPFIEVEVEDGKDKADYVVQGVVGQTGTVAVTASAPGFLSGTGTIDVVPGGVDLVGLASSQRVGIHDDFTIVTGPINSTGTGLEMVQAPSGSNDPYLELTVASSDGAVGELSGFGRRGATISLLFVGTRFQTGATLEPLSVGTTSVSATIPGLISLPSASMDVAVAPPRVTPFSAEIGAGLQLFRTARIDVSNHGGVTFHVQSSDPTVALIAPNLATPGSPSADVFIPDGGPVVGYAVQGVAGARGSSTVTVSAPGFESGTGTITVGEPGVAISGLGPTQTVGQNDAFTVRFLTRNSSGAWTDGGQSISAAANAQPVLTLTSDNGLVGELSGRLQSGATITFPLLPGDREPIAMFIPVAGGATTVTASIPDFITTAYGSVRVTVSP